MGGIFGSKTKIYVDSSVMNLNGSDNQTKFVPTTIVGGAIASERNLGQYFIDQLFQASGAKLRSFYRWARRSGYTNAIGLSSSTFYSDVPIDRSKLLDVLMSVIPHNPTNQFIELDEARIDWFDIQWLGENWTSVNRPDLMGKVKEIKLTNTLIGEHKEKRKEYYETNEGTDWRWVWVTVPDYRQDVKITYTNGEEVILTKTEYDENARYLYINYRIVTFQLKEIPGDPKPDIPAVDENGNPILDKDGNQIMIPQPPDPPTYIQEILNEEPRFVMYCEGGNLEYYNQFFKTGTVLEGTYFPYIPLEHDKNWLSESFMPDAYKWAKKAYKKLSGRNKYDKFVKNVRESEGIDKCQFIYMQFGVSINTAWMEGKRYIFEFFYNLYLNESISIGAGNNIGVIGGGLKGVLEYLKKEKKKRTVLIRSTHGICNFSNKISWEEMSYSLHNGKIFEGAKKNKYRVYRDSADYYYTVTEWDNETGEYEVQKKGTHHYTILEHQISANRFERLTILTLKGEVVVYGGKSKEYWGYDELANYGDEIIDEKTAKGESGFLIPLEYTSFKELGLVSATDLAVCSQYLVCNSYLKKKIKWYQRGIFKVVVAIVAVVLAVFTAGQSMVMYLTTYYAMSTIAAVAVTAVVMAAFSIVMSKLIMPLLIKVFSAMFGQIIGTIVAYIASIIISYGMSAALTGVSITWSSMCTITNVMKLAVVAINAVSDYMAQSASNMLGSITSMVSQYTDMMNQINEKSSELFGRDSLVSKSVFTQAYVPESPQSFLTRTLATGADNANMTLDMLYNFPTYTIALTNPITH